MYPGHRSRREREGGTHAPHFQKFVYVRVGRTGISNVICRGIFLFSALMCKAILRFVDIDCIVEPFCLNVLFIIMISTLYSLSIWI